MAEQHPIQGIMYTAMQSIREMIDVNTIVGDAVQTPDGTVIIPISKVGLGFGVGGSDYMPEHIAKNADASTQPLFGGGVGGGVSITPVAFMVVGNGQIRLMPVTAQNNLYDRLIDAIPAAIDKVIEGVGSLKKNGKANGLDVKVAEPMSEDEMNDFLGNNKAAE